MDGKYYLIKKHDKKLTGNPGIPDIVKQYIYNSALRSFVNSCHIGSVANAFLIPALDSEKSDVDGLVKLGTIPYWTMQTSTFKELPTLQVIKIKPSLVWKNYLQNKVLDFSKWNCIQLTPTENYLYHNESDISVEIKKSLNKQKHILSGFVRKEYFNHIELNKLNEFIFYFYSTDEELRYPMHPNIDFCTEFIGYNDKIGKFLTGKLEITNNGRCKIDEIPQDKLIKLLQNKYKYTKPKSSAVKYYIVKITNVKIVEKPYNGIPDFKSLERMIKFDGLNDVLYKYSPKVINVG